MDKKLSKEAYGNVAGKDYIPYLAGETKQGGSGVVLIIGIVLAILFGASTAYSGMKAGLTVAAGIPGSILGSVLLAAFAKNKGLLGKTLLQGMSSGGESIASGIIFVLPAVILLGSQITFIEGLVIGVGGALLGAGGASLVYKYLLVEEHGKLMYPESMAISETLVASEGQKESVKYMGIGFGIGGIITVFTGSFLGIVNNVIDFTNETFYKWRFQLEVNPLLLGIGFIVGIPVSLTMFAGSLLSNFAVIPLVGYFTSLSSGGPAVWNDPSITLNAMDVSAISGSYVKYIGAGMMLSGGIIGAVKLIPIVVASLRETLAARSSGKGEGSIATVFFLVSIVIGFVGGFLVSGGNVLMIIVATVLSIILSLLFVIVSGRLTGTIGTSNLPVSGMTIACVVLLTLVFVGFGWTSAANNRSLLLFATFIVTAIAAAGGYCQSQKVSFIIGGSKSEMDKYYGIATVVGVATVIGVIMLLSRELAVTGDNASFALPQANLMATLTSGIMSGNLPWPMLIVGIVMGIVVYMLNLPVMTVAIGFYLPISTTSIILLGALLHLMVEKVSKSVQERETRISNGISLSSGLVAGGSIIGLIGIILQVTNVIKPGSISGFAAGNGMAFLLLILLVVATVIPLMYGGVKQDK